MSSLRFTLKRAISSGWRHESGPYRDDATVHALEGAQRRLGQVRQHELDDLPVGRDVGRRAAGRSDADHAAGVHQEEPLREHALSHFAAPYTCLLDHDS